MPTFKTSRILFTTALFNFFLGLACLFAPAEIARALGSGTEITALSLQLLGAALLAMAMLNWMIRETAIGGIYGRPLVLANLIHFNTGFLVFFKAALAADDGLITSCGAAVYGLLALTFWSRLLARGPKSSP